MKSKKALLGGISGACVVGLIYVLFVRPGPITLEEINALVSSMSTNYVLHPINKSELTTGSIKVVFDRYDQPGEIEEILFIKKRGLRVGIVYEQKTLTKRQKDVAGDLIVKTYPGGNSDYHFDQIDVGNITGTNVTISRHGKRMEIRMYGTNYQILRKGFVF